MTIKGVRFVNGVATLSGDPVRQADLIKYLAYWQALPVDEADALQAKLDASTVDVDELSAKVADAEAQVRALEAKLADKKKDHGKVEDSTSAPSGKQSGSPGDKTPSKQPSSQSRK